MNKRRGRTVPQTRPQISDNTVALARIDTIYRLLKPTIFWAGLCLTLLCAGFALRPFAGQVTVVSVFLSFLADIKFAVAVTLAGAACAWAAAERILRRRKTEQLQGRIIELERMIDPRRTSSELTPQGTTNPKDR